MIYKCTNGFVVFRFESIQEMEMLQKIVPFPNLVPYTENPLTFIPATQAENRYLIAGQPVSPLATVTVSNENIVEGFKENRLTYSFFEDGIVMRDTITRKVSLSVNDFGKYWCNFLLQPYSLVGLMGRATDFECVFIPSRGVYVFTYIRFAYE